MEKPLENTEEFISNETSRFLGDYIVVFQYIENCLDQILQLSMGLEKFKFTKMLLSELSNSSKIKCVRSIMNGALSDNIDRHKIEWLAQFDKTMKALAVEAETRNKLVHGTYLYEVAKHGGPVLLGYSRVGKKGMSDKSECLHKDKRDELLKNVRELAIQMNFALVQIRNWSADLFEEE